MMRLMLQPVRACRSRAIASAVGPFPVWWTLVRFAVPDRVKGS